MSGPSYTYFFTVIHHPIGSSWIPDHKMPLHYWNQSFYVHPVCKHSLQIVCNVAHLLSGWLVVQACFHQPQKSPSTLVKQHRQRLVAHHWSSIKRRCTRKAKKKMLKKCRDRNGKVVYINIPFAPGTDRCFPTMCATQAFLVVHCEKKKTCKQIWNLFGCGAKRVGHLSKISAYPMEARGGTSAYVKYESNFFSVYTNLKLAC